MSSRTVEVYDCDWCGTIGEIDEDEKTMPNGWHHVAEAGADLCPRCFAERAKAIAAARELGKARQVPADRQEPRRSSPSLVNRLLAAGDGVIEFYGRSNSTPALVALKEAMEAFE
jgi:hypothetical protein